MPFNGNASFNSAGYGMQAAQEIAAAIEQYKKRQAEDETNNALVTHAARLGLIDINDINEYQSANGKKKNEIAHGIVVNMMQDQQRKRADAKMQAEMMNANANYANVQSEIGHRKYAQEFRPNMIDVTPPDGKPRTLIQQQPGGPWQGLGALDESGQGNTPLQLTPDEIASGAKNNKVPLRTSNKSFQWVDTPEPQGTNDPSTWRRVLIPGTKDQFAVVDGNGQLVPNSKLQGVLHPDAQTQRMTALGLNVDGSPAPAAPAPSPAPVGTVQPTANSAATQQADTATQAAQIKAAFKAGTITQDDAVKKLQALGFQ